MSLAIPYPKKRKKINPPNFVKVEETGFQNCICSTCEEVLVAEQMEDPRNSNERGKD